MIIGAGRSGTNALRDTLTAMPGFDTWPCDEINYVWRHGNRDFPTDELTPAHATPLATGTIRAAFARRQRLHPRSHIVEKTCANSLRVGFVNEVMPEALVVHIVRDPVDTVASAMKRWTAPIDVPYLMRKVRFVPAADLSHYAFRYVKSRFARRGNLEKSLSTWGPRFSTIDESVRSSELHEVCAEQWSACVSTAHEQLAAYVNVDDVVHVRYRDFVTDTEETISRIMSALEFEAVPRDLSAACANIHTSSLGAGYRSLPLDQVREIERRSRDVVKRWL